MAQKEKGAYRYYYYNTANNREVLKSFPMGLPHDTDTKIVVDSLLKYLSDNYFKTVYYATDTITTHIKLTLLRIDSIKTKSRIIKLAVVDIVDTSRICMRNYFQGSTGGHMTQIMLGANILQPQFYYTSHFLDGVILLYNGTSLDDLDHIDLSGILVPSNYFRYTGLVL